MDESGMATPTPANRTYDGSNSSLKMAAATPAPKKAPCNCKKSKCLKLYVDVVLALVMLLYGILFADIVV